MSKPVLVQASEHSEQVALFNWAEFQVCRWPELVLMHAIPNGGRRDGRTGAMLKAEGVKAGIPDVFLPVARSGYHGLYIEMKTATGSPSKEQKRWLAALQKQGYFTAVCRGWHPATRLLTAYMTGQAGTIAKEAFTHGRTATSTQQSAVSAGSRRRVHRPRAIGRVNRARVG